MALTKNQKESAMKEARRHEGDTGSPEAQISLKTEIIRRLTLHLKKNKKDVDSKKGLIRAISERRKLSTYLKQKNEGVYKKLMKKLGLKEQV